MACSQYFVQPSANDGWVARLGDRECGPYQSRDMALRVAVADTLQRRKAGQEIRIVVKDSQGAICATRCLCPNFTH